MPEPEKDRILGEGLEMTAAVQMAKFCGQEGRPGRRAAWLQGRTGDGQDGRMRQAGALQGPGVSVLGRQLCP